VAVADISRDIYVSSKAFVALSFLTAPITATEMATSMQSICGVNYLMLLRIKQEITSLAVATNRNCEMHRSDTRGQVKSSSHWTCNEML